MNSWLRTGSSTKNSTKQGKHKTFQAKTLKPNQISELDLIIVKQRHINTISRFKVDWSLINTFRKDKYDHGMLRLWYRPHSPLTRIPVNFQNLRVKRVIQHGKWPLLEKQLKILSDEGKLTHENMTAHIHLTTKKLVKNHPQLWKNPQPYQNTKREPTPEMFMLQNLRQLTDIKDKKTHNEIDKAMKLEGLKAYDAYIDNTAKLIEKNFKQNNLKVVHRLLNILSKKQKKNKLPIYNFHTGKMYKNNKEIANEFAKHFKSIFSDKSKLKSPQHFRHIKLSFIPFINTNTPTKEEILSVMKEMKKHKASGPDGIPVEAYLQSNTLQAHLVFQIREFWRTGTLDNELATGNTILLYKKGNRDVLSNYRPITLLNHHFKILTKLINNRLKPLVRGTVLFTQTGFRERYNTVDCLTAIRRILRQLNDKNENFLFTFIDFQKAFDTIAQDWLQLAMEEHGIPPRIRTLISAIFSSAKIHIKINQGADVGISQPIQILNGVLQGDSLSPTLFILALDSIVRRIPSDLSRILLLENLGFADDVALISSSLDVALQKLAKDSRTNTLHWITHIIQQNKTNDN